MIDVWMDGRTEEGEWIGIANKSHDWSLVAAIIGGGGG